MTRPIFFLTDFGLPDIYVGVVKAVMLGIAPDARVVDLTHDIPPQDVRAGAFALMTAMPYLPPDAVVLAVVDPGVGTARRPIAVQAAGRTFVGPDNGLLSWAVRRSDLTPQPPLRRGEGGPAGVPAARPSDADDAALHRRGESVMRPPVHLPLSAPERGLGGEVSAVVLDRPRFWRPTVSATFHGRDLFGPIAAHLALGVPLAEVGSPCGPIQELPFPPVELTYTAQERAGAGSIPRRIATARGEVIHVDRFGNLIANLAAGDLPEHPSVEVAGRTIVGLAPHFQPLTGVDPTSGEAQLVALIGSSGLLEIAVPNGSAAVALGIGVGAAIVVRAAER